MGVDEWTTTHFRAHSFSEAPDHQTLKHATQMQIFTIYNFMLILLISY